MPHLVRAFVRPLRWIARPVGGRRQVRNASSRSHATKVHLHRGAQSGGATAVLSRTRIPKTHLWICRRVSLRTKCSSPSMPRANSPNASDHLGPGDRVRNRVRSSSAEGATHCSATLLSGPVIQLVSNRCHPSS